MGSNDILAYILGLRFIEGENFVLSLQNDVILKVIFSKFHHFRETILE